MQSKLTTILVIEDYTRDLKLPAGVEQDAREGKVELWNTARPFPAHEHYQGEFLRGVHYGVIRPDAEYADLMREDAQRLDAHRVEFVSKATVMAYGQELADEYEMDLAEFDYQDVVMSYVGKREREG